jgi:PAS domain S-box-containing protein
MNTSKDYRDVLRIVVSAAIVLVMGIGAICLAAEDMLIPAVIAVLLLAGILTLLSRKSYASAANMAVSEYITVLDNLEDAICEIDLKKKTFRYIGGGLKSANFLVNKDIGEVPISELFPPEAMAQMETEFAKKYDEWLHNKTPYLLVHFVVQSYTRFDTLEWLDISAKILADGNSEPSKAIAAVRYVPTEQIEHKDAVEKNNEHLLSVLNNIRDVVWELDLATNQFTYANAASFPVCGVLQDEIIGMSMDKFFSATDTQKLKGMIHSFILAYQRGELTDMSTAVDVVMHNQYTNTDTIAEISAAIIMDGTQFKSVVGVTRDISHRRNMTAAAQKRSDICEMIERCSDEILCIVDIGTLECEFISESVADMFGFTADEIRDYGVASIMNITAIDAIKNKIVEKTQDEKYNSVAIVATHRNGSSVKCEISFCQLNDFGYDDYSPNELFMRIMPPHEVVTTADEDKNEKEFYKMMVENGRDTIWMMDVKALTYTFISSASVVTTGYKPNELIGKSIELVSTDSSYELFTKTIKREIDRYLGGETTSIQFGMECQLKHKMGYLVWVEIAAKAIMNNNGEPTQILGVTRRIDARKEQELRFVRQKEELKSLNDTKEKFFSVIGHDIKNPISALISTAQVFNDHYSEMTDVDISKNVAMLKESAMQVYKLLDNLLQWSRSATGEIPYHPTKTDMLDLIMSAIEHLKAQASLKNININIDSETHNNNIAICDENMIKTVIQNLVSNAIKFSHPSGKINIKIANYSNDKHSLLISVEDEGIGINPAQISKLFALSTDEISADDGNVGTGLGLVLCKEFIDKHNGEIWVESTLGEGSKFYFTLLKG